MHDPRSVVKRAARGIPTRFLFEAIDAAHGTGIDSLTDSGQCAERERCADGCIHRYVFQRIEIAIGSAGPVDIDIDLVIIPEEFVNERSVGQRRNAQAQLTRGHAEFGDALPGGAHFDERLRECE